jgi:hypothetical protein
VRKPEALSAELAAEVEAYPERFEMRIAAEPPKSVIEKTFGRVEKPFEMQEMAAPIRSVRAYREAWAKTFGRWKLSPREALLAGWIHIFLWGMSDADRAFMLGAIFGFGEPDQRLRAAQIGPILAEFNLKGWNDFPDTYPQPPIWIELFRK